MASTSRISSALAAMFLLMLPPLTGCGDSGSASTGTAGSTGTTPGTGTSETSTGTTESPTTSGTMGSTGSTGTTTEPGTTTSPDTTTGPGTTTGPTTDTTTGTTGTTDSTTGTTDTTTGTTDTGSTTGSTTGEPIGSTCEQDSDCQLHTDCCTCDVLAKDEAPPQCDIMECFVDVCSTLDIGNQAPVCRFGRCTFAKVTCNPTAVTCKALPPDCPVGQIPSVNGDCWSGQCSPVEACDWAPDCGACKTDPTDPLVCVLKAQKGAYHVCEPKPVDCGDAPEIDCDCGAEICAAMPPHTECHDQVPGIVCECPFC